MLPVPFNLVSFHLQTRSLRAALGRQSLIAAIVIGHVIFLILLATHWQSAWCCHWDKTIVIRDHELGNNRPEQSRRWAHMCERHKLDELRLAKTMADSSCSRLLQRVRRISSVTISSDQADRNDVLEAACFKTLLASRTSFPEGVADPSNRVLCSAVHNSN